MAIELHQGDLLSLERAGFSHLIAKEVVRFCDSGIGLPKALEVAGN